MKRVGLLLLVLLSLLAIGAQAQTQEMRTLYYGSVGDDVTALQQRLEDLGYYTFRVTGNYQENTQKAVKGFQAAHGYPADGVATVELQVLIFGDSAMLASSVPASTQPPSLPVVEYPGKQEYGNTGDHVRRIQARLSELGYYNMNISGEFWKNTRNAVKEFQKQNGLAADGVVGAATWQALFFDAEAVDAAATPKPTPSPSPVPYRIGVDVTNQITSVYGLDEAGGYTALVKQMLCSTGTDKDPTPSGTYTLNGATARWCYFPKWGTHAQYWTRIDAYNAFHSVIYSEANSMALKKGSYTGLGKKASHGCIRLMVEDAKWIYQNCGKGVEVVVYEGDYDEELTKSFKIPPLDESVMLPVPTPDPTTRPVYISGGTPPQPFTTLERGVESEAVFWLQCKLAELGYYTGSITGGYYDGTAQAIKAFQKENGLSADGKAGKKTLQVLYERELSTAPPLPEATPWIAAESILSAGETLQQPTPTPAATAATSLIIVTPSPSPSPTPEAPSGSDLYIPREERIISNGND